MSEFHIQVVRVGPIEKHPNADSLGVTRVYDYPVIVKLGEFQEGALAAYIPVDSVVPQDDPRWAFLQGHTHVKAKRLRGVFSMGLLTPAEPGWAEGQNVQEVLRIEKREPPEPREDNEKDPGFLPAYTDIEGLRRWPDVLQPGEPTILQEKVHGANSRFLFHQGRLWVGSHKCIKKESSSSLWWKAAKALSLEQRLQANCPGVVLYGEVYGQVQALKYGVPPGSPPQLVLFDAFSLQDQKYLDFGVLHALSDLLEIPLAPILYNGPWDPEICLPLAEGNSLLSQDCIREGFVVRPAGERWDERIGRVILKYHGEGFLTRKRK